MSGTRTTITRTAIILALFACIGFSERVYEARASEVVVANINFFPTQVIQASDFGLHSATASFMWLDFIQHAGQPGGAIGAATILRAVTDLDPRFSYPYAFGVLILPALDATNGREDAVAIGAKAIALGIEDWRIPFYLATDYHGAGDIQNALYYFQIAAETKGISPEMRATALSYGTQKNNRERTKSIWQSIYNSSRDELVIDQAKSNLIHIEILETLESATALYKKQYKRSPKDVQALIDAKIIKAAPEDPLGFTYSIDSAGNVKPEFNNLTF